MGGKEIWHQHHLCTFLCPGSLSSLRPARIDWHSALTTHGELGRFLKTCPEDLNSKSALTTAKINKLRSQPPQQNFCRWSLSFGRRVESASSGCRGRRPGVGQVLQASRSSAVPFARGDLSCLHAAVQWVSGAPGKLKWFCADTGANTREI